MTIEEYREKRSLRANRYYWQLLGQLCKKVGVKKSVKHNELLRECGCLVMIDGRVWPGTFPERLCGAIDQSVDEHWLPTGHHKTLDNGEEYRVYLKLRGSKTFNTSEMAHLINLLIQDCQDQGIETATPQELAEMLKYHKAINKVSDNG